MLIDSGCTCPPHCFAPTFALLGLFSFLLSNKLLKLALTFLLGLLFRFRAALYLVDYGMKFRLQ